MKNMALILALTGAVSSMQAGADTLGGLYAGVQAWQMRTDGTFGSNNSNAEFDFEDDSQGVYYIALEHPVTFLPDVKLRHNELSTSGNTVLKGQFSFGGTTYSDSAALTTAMDLTNTDLILYYELFDNSLFSVDLGLNIKYLDGEITVTEDGGSSSTEQLRAPLPLGYVKAELGLPLTGLSTFGEVNYMTLDGHSLSDYQLGVAYQLIDTPAIDMNVHAGYRAMALELDDLDNVDANIDFDGAFVGIEAHF